MHRNTHPLEYGGVCAALGIAYAERGRDSNSRGDFDQSVVHLKYALEVQGPSCHFSHDLFYLLFNQLLDEDFNRNDVRL